MRTLLALFVALSFLLPPALALAGDDALPVVLLDPGSGKKTKLRYTSKVGEKQQVEMRMAMTMSMEVDGQKMDPQTAPTMVFVIGSEITEAGADGSAAYRFTYVDAKAEGDSEMAASMGRSLEPLRGLTGRARRDNRGFTESMEFDMSPDMPPAMAEMIQSVGDAAQKLSVPFPDEAVAKGASWQVGGPVTLNGMTIDQVTRYDFAGMEDGRVVLIVTQQQSAKAQDIPMPGMPGAVTHLESLTGSGKGRTVLGFGEVLPRESTMTAESAFSMTVTMGDASQKMNATNRTDLAMHPVGE